MNDERTSPWREDRPTRLPLAVRPHCRAGDRPPFARRWLGLFDDPILGNSALDRLANASYQIVIEGESY